MKNTGGVGMEQLLKDILATLNTIPCARVPAKLQANVKFGSTYDICSAIENALANAEPEREMYHIYYREDAGYADSEPDMDGIILLSAEEHTKLEAQRLQMDNEDDEYSLTKVTPYDFEDANKYIGEKVL